jgi:hypothetical protein
MITRESIDLLSLFMYSIHIAEKDCLCDETKVQSYFMEFLNEVS